MGEQDRGDLQNTEKKLLDLIVGIDRFANERTLFKNPVEALPQIENIIRLGSRHVIGNVLHICEGGKCHLKRIKAFLYRQTAPARAQRAAPSSNNHYTGHGASHGMEIVPVSKQAHINFAEIDSINQSGEFIGAFLHNRANELVHVCVPEFCEHLAPGHNRQVCSASGLPCPHSVLYTRPDTYEFTNLFACADTGNVHMCGSACRQKNTTLGNTGSHVCPLTSIVLGSQIENNILAPGAPPPLPLGYGDSDAPIPKGKTCNKNLSPAEQIKQERNLFIDKARVIICELLCSTTRQSKEILTICKSGRLIMQDIHGIVRRKASPAAYKMSPLIRAMQTYYEKWPKPSLDYFARVALMPAMQVYAEKQGRDTVMSTDLVRTSHLSIGRDDIFLSETSKERIREFQRRIEAHYPPVEPEKCKYSLEDIRAEALVIAKCAMILFEKINGFEKLFASFKSVSIHLIYMMQNGYEIPVESGNLEDTCTVTVIPKFPILQLLPLENTLPEYKLVKENACLARSINDVTKAVHGVYNRISKSNLAYDYEFKMEEID